MQGRTFAAAAAAVAILAACGGDRADDAPPPPATDGPAATPGVAPAGGDAAVRPVRVELFDGQGEMVGTAELTEAANGVQIAVRAMNLPPGPHGIHVHETGRCDGPSFESAGGHFAPEGRQHGLENPAGPHAGDLPNLEVGTDGSVETAMLNDRVTLRAGQPNSLLRAGGTALVIHESADDQRTDPSGDSGARIACGVIGTGG